MTPIGHLAQTPHFQNLAHLQSREPVVWATLSSDKGPPGSCCTLIKLSDMDKTRLSVYPEYQTESSN